MPDIRLRSLGGSINEELLDRAIRHSIFLERLKTGQANKIAAFLEDKLFPDLKDQLERRLKRIRIRGFDTSPATTQRLRDMMSSLDEIVRTRTSSARRLLKEDLSKLARQEAAFQRDLIRGMSPIELNVAVPDLRTLNSVITARPFQGKLLREWFSSLDQATRGNMRDAVSIGVSQGESIPAISRRVQSFFPTTRRQATAIVRTAVNHVSAHAREATFEENGNLVKAVQYVATLDHRTTLICAGLDGQVFPVGEGPRPPQHIQCRSTTTPVLRSWKELGINLKEAPIGTRASLNGQVPATTTYGQWLRRQPTSVQNEVLGPARARLFRSGKVKINQFVDTSGRTLTLDELRALEG